MFVYFVSLIFVDLFPHFLGYLLYLQDGFKDVAERAGTLTVIAYSKTFLGDLP